MDKHYEVIEEIYSHIKKYGKGPGAEQFLVDHYDLKNLIEKMEVDGVLKKDDLGRYFVPVRYLCGLPFCEKDMKLANKLILRLTEVFRGDVNRVVELTEIPDPEWVLVKPQDIQRVLGYLEELYCLSAMKLSNEDNRRIILAVRPRREILDCTTIEEAIKNYERMVQAHKKSLELFAKPKEAEMKKVFISHAAKDEALVNLFVDLLDTGTTLNQKDLFCSSVKGMDIPNYEDFVKHIKGQLEKSQLVIVILSPNYIERAFCNCELGATWFGDKHCFVLGVPPLKYDDIKGVMVGKQLGMISDSSALDDLKDYLAASLADEGATSRWNKKKEEFLASLPDIIKKLPKPEKVLFNAHIKLQEAFSQSMKKISELEGKIEKQTGTINKLSELKDKKEVDAVKTEESGDYEKFESLVRDVRDALDEISDTIVKDVLFAHMQKKEYHWPGFGMDSERDALHAAIDNGYLFDGDEYIGVNTGDPAVERSLKLLKTLDEFLSGESMPEFHKRYKAEYGMEADIHNKRFWKEHFK